MGISLFRFCPVFLGACTFPCSRLRGSLSCCGFFLKLRISVAFPSTSDVGRFDFWISNHRSKGSRANLRIFLVFPQLLSALTLGSYLFWVFPALLTTFYLLRPVFWVFPHLLSTLTGSFAIVRTEDP